MIKSSACVLGFTVAVALWSGTAFAASMTKSEMATMKECQNMSKSAMQNDKNCTALTKKYPDAMNGSGSMSGSGSMNSSGSMDNGSMKGGSMDHGTMNNGGGSMSNSTGGMSK